MIIRKFLNPFYILTIFSCLYLTQILPVSPFYFGLFFTLCATLICFSIRPRVILLKIKKKYIPLIIHCIVISVYVFFNAVINSCGLKYPILQLLSMLFLVLSFILPTNNKDFIKKTFYHLITIVIVLLSIEFVYRITHPKTFDWATEVGNFFYIYKFSSIMFSDSNETAFFILIFISLLLYFNDTKFVFISKKKFLLFFIFLVGTFSRAAVFAFLVLLFYNFIFKRLNIFIKILLLFFSFFLFTYVLMIFSKDGSFLTKIDIFLRTINYLKYVSIRDFFIGVGINNSIDALGFYGHNYISLYLVEYGFIGLLLLLTLFIHIFYLCPKTYFLLVPYLVAGLSFAPYFVPYFYFFIGIIIHLEEINK